MKKIILTTLILIVASLTCFAAGGIHFLENKKWKDVLALAKKQNKLIFLDAYATWCGPCKYMKQNIFTQAQVGNFYNGKFINVKMDMEAGEGIDLAKELGMEAYPTLFFINGKGEVVHKSVGALNAIAFLELGRTALDPKKQFYSIKRDAEQGRLTPAQFHAWLAEAENTDEKIVDSTVARYLRKVSYPLLEKKMLHILIDYAQSLSKEQVDFLFAHQAEIGRIMAYSSSELEHHLLRKLRAYALHMAAEADSVNFARFESLVAGYAPGSAWTETQWMRTTMHFAASEPDEAVNDLLALLARPNSGLFASDLASLVIDQSEQIAEHEKVDSVRMAILAFQLRPDELTKTYYKDLSILAIALKQKDADDIRDYAAKVYDNPEAPEALRERVKDLRDYK
jgi:thiol-disulfide isomerase/thioredoxin